MPRPVSPQTRNEMRMSEKASRDLGQAHNPIERLRLLCLQRGASGIIGFGKIFRRMDNDQSGELSRTEFIDGLRESGFDLNHLDFNELFAQFDKDKSGQISYQELLEQLRPPMNKYRVRLIEMAFSKLDVTKDGKVTIEDLKSAYNIKNHPSFLNGTKTADQLFAEFLTVFEQHGSIDGILTKDEFLDYYSTVSASIDDDMYFDLVMRQAWKL